jgi:choline dehydrogenase-like flavoprotein
MFLTRRQRRTLASFAEALLPSGGAIPYGAADVGTTSAVEEQIGRLPRRFHVLVGLALTVWEALPFISQGRGFSRLSMQNRLRWIEASLASRLALRRLLALWLKMLCMAAYTADRRVEEAIGFTRSCLDESPPRDGPHLTAIAYPTVWGDVQERADAVVIGSGAGGAVVAKELAEAGLSVVVIEEGAYFKREDYAEGAPWQRVQKLYRDSGLTAAFGSPPIPIPLGKAVGGTTLVNSGTCFRTPDRILRQWGSRWGIEGIDPETMEPVFSRVEETMHIKPVPWEIIGNNAQVFHRGVEALGYHGRPMLRAIDGCRGCGVCAFGCPSDAKQAMHLAYLPRAAAHGAKIYARCRARRILVERGRAAGVEADIMDPTTDEARGRLHVRAPIVVLAAGAIHTPALLIANGLALRSGQVGHHLRIHPAVAVAAAFEEDVFGWRGTLQSYYVDDLQESHGVLLEVTSPLPETGAPILPEVGHKLKEGLADYKRLASVGLFVSDSSQGRVLRGFGRGWWSSPTVVYSLNQEDTGRLQRGIALAAEIFLAAGATAVLTGVRGVPPITDRGELRDFQKLTVRSDQLSPVGFHPMGTCRMGRDPAKTVVNPFGEAHEVRNLFVADASVFPSCMGVNPQISIMAFATRTAFRILNTGS